MITGIVRRLESMGENEIPSNVIGELVMQALSSLDKVAYVRFASVYKNFRETKDFESLRRRAVERRPGLDPGLEPRLRDTTAMPANSNSDDIGHMRHALRAGRARAGQTAPNPAVGCVIVSRDGRVVGRGWTQAGGRPHAETEALAQAGDLRAWRAPPMSRSSPARITDRRRLAPMR